MPKSLFDAFSADQNAEQNGITLDFGDFKFVIARAGGANRKYLAAVRRIIGPHQRAAEMEVLADSKSRELLAECFADAIVLGWESKFQEKDTGAESWRPVVIGKDGQEIPYSRANCKQLLIDLPDLFDALRDEAVKLSNFLQARREESARD